MNLFGFQITRQKATVSAMSVANNPGLIPIRLPMGPILEAYPGYWQKNISKESLPNLLAFSAVYACIALIADDIGKLRICLERKNENQVWEEINEGSPFLPVLRKPNRYQTRIQFLQYWIVSKLMYGNAYILLQRDGRGVVDAMYPLDPRLVTTMVRPDGEVLYQLSNDYLTNTKALALVSSSEIIHDRMNTLFHQLCGVSPIYACGASATQGLRIQNNSEAFFANMSRPSGILTSPVNIDDPTADRLKRDFEKNFSGANVGRLMVGGNGLKYEPMTIPANDSQLIEQQKWTVEDVARAFKVPLHKIAAGQNPTFSNIGAMNQDYYNQTLQTHIEAIELLLDEALGLPALGMGVELDLEGLLRMDPKTRAETTEIEMRSATLSPDEARMRENRNPVAGGDSPYLQQQNFSLAALAKRDAMSDPFGMAKPEPQPVSEEEDISEDDAKELELYISKELECA